MIEPSGDTPQDKAAAPVADVRLRQGLETTLLAWVRTGLALMGFGFVLARFGLFLLELQEASHISSRQIHLSLWSGVVLLGLGVAVNLVAAALHYPYLVRARRGETDLPPTWWLGLVLSLVLGVIGATMAVLLVIMSP